MGSGKARGFTKLEAQATTTPGCSGGLVRGQGGWEGGNGQGTRGELGCGRAHTESTGLEVPPGLGCLLLSGRSCLALRP